MQGQERPRHSSSGAFPVRKSQFVLRETHFSIANLQRKYVFTVKVNMCSSEIVFLIEKEKRFQATADDRVKKKSKLKEIIIKREVLEKTKCVHKKREVSLKQGKTL